MLGGEGSIDELRGVAGQPAADAQLVGEALGGLEHGVAVVLMDEFGAAEAQDIGMHVAGAQLGLQVVGTQFGLCEGASGGDPHEGPVAAQLETGEGKDLVGSGTERLVGLARAEEPVGRKRELDEARDAVPRAVAPLDVFERVAQASPLGADVRGRQPRLGQRPVDLSAGRALTEDPGEILELTGGERRLRLESASVRARPADSGRARLLSRV